MTTSGLLLALLAGAVAAAPAGNSGGSCTFTDANSVASSKKSCSEIFLQDIKVPAGQTLDLTKLNTGTSVTFQGTTTFGYKEWDGPLISVSGSSIRIKGAAGHLIDYGGAQWWDNKGSNGGKKKPNAFFAHDLTDSTITGLNVKNTPVQFMSIVDAKNLAVSNVVMDNSAGDSSGGHNTDAFNIAKSTGVTITGAQIKNQDDCLAVNSGSNIVFTGGSCSGGHGLSIGSVGGRNDNTVKNVLMANTKVANSQNGVRIKTVYGATGLVSNVTYSGITLSNISQYGIVFQQDYQNGSPTGKPTTGVPITGVTMDGVTGSVARSANPIYIVCGKGSCNDFDLNGVDLSGGKRSAKCQNVPAGATC